MSAYILVLSSLFILHQYSSIWGRDGGGGRGGHGTAKEPENAKAQDDVHGGKAQGTWVHIHWLHEIIKNLLEADREMKKDKDGNPLIFHYVIWTDNSPTVEIDCISSMTIYVSISELLARSQSIKT